MPLAAVSSDPEEMLGHGHPLEPELTFPLSPPAGGGVHSWHTRGPRRHLRLGTQQVQLSQGLELLVMLMQGTAKLGVAGVYWGPASNRCFANMISFDPHKTP